MKHVNYSSSYSLQLFEKLNSSSYSLQLFEKLKALNVYFWVNITYLLQHSVQHLQYLGHFQLLPERSTALQRLRPQLQVQQAQRWADKKKINYLLSTLQRNAQHFLSENICPESELSGKTFTRNLRYLILWYA